MSPDSLFAAVDDVLGRIDYPSWPAAEDPSSRERLEFFESGEDGPAQWAFVPVADQDRAEVDVFPVDVRMAAALVKEHLREWLLERGWQVQAFVRKERTQWRLVDCLSMADGGGDRLSDTVDYPSGEDELSVACASVRAVLHGTRPSNTLRNQAQPQ